MLLRTTVLIATVAALAAPTPARAASTVRYASPSGGGDCSTAAKACTLLLAFAAAKSTDEIVLATPGTYTVASSLTDAPNGTLNIHPAAGIGRPTLSLAAGADITLGAGSTLRDVDVIKSAAVNRAFALAYGGTLNRVRLTFAAATTSATAIELYSGAILGSEIVASGTTVTAVRTSSNNSSSFTGTMVGDTVVASGTGAVAASFDPVGLTASNVQTNVVANTILHGTATDLRVVAAGQSEQAEVYSSAYVTKVVSGAHATLNDHGGRITGAPLFGGAADFHQALGSPTVNAGTSAGPFAALIGPTDLDGEARVQGSSIDIGADERADAVLDPGGPTEGGGTGDGGGTPDAGAPADPGPGAGAGVSAPGDAGVSATDASAGTDPRAADGPATALRLVSTTATLKRGRLAVRVACPAGAAACTGVLTVRLGRVRLAAAKLSVAAGKTVTVRLQPSTRTVAQIRRFGHQGKRTTATVATTSGTARAGLLVRGR